MKNQDVFSLRVREKREECKLTVHQLSDKCGLSPGAISLIENGHSKNPLVRTVEKLAEALNTSPIYLLGWEKLDSK